MKLDMKLQKMTRERLLFVFATVNMSISSVSHISYVAFALQLAVVKCQVLINCQSSLSAQWVMELNLWKAMLFYASLS